METKDKQIYGWIDEVCKEIPLFFNDEKCIKTHLDAFATWSEYEWFNIALILYQRPSATIINSKKNWEELLNKEFFIKKGDKGLRVIIPLIEENQIKWKQGVVWDIEQCQERIEVGIVSKLKICIEEIFSRNIYESINEKDGLIDFLLEKSMNHIHKSIKCNEISSYIRSCIIYLLSHYLPLSNVKYCLNLKGDFTNNQYVYLYSGIKTVVNYLDQYIFDYYETLTSREKEKAEIEYAKRIWNMTIHERIENAQIVIKEKAQSVVSNDASENYDLEEPTGNERRVVQ